MKLRKLFSAAAMALLVGVAATAQTSVEDVRIYINPGHGSWGPNNRHCATIGHNPISTASPDTTDFFESNTNLRKCFALLGKLIEYGVPFDHSKNQTNTNPNRIGAALDMSQNIVMSHVKCGPYPYDANDSSTDSGNDFNRTLSVITAEVDANDFDMFISIHSNAATEGSLTNYLYFAWDNSYTTGEGTTVSSITTDGETIRDASISMSNYGWNHRILDRHTQWTSYDNLVGEGTVKIGYQNLGVLNHTVPGYLVEGYFHTYQPARHRYMNFDVCRIEGIDYARGVADYFGWSKETTNGCIYGIVRDKDTKFSDDLYNAIARTNDVYKPLNGVVVTLKKEDGTTYATDTTDVNYNGAFVFLNVPTGNYTLEFSHADYKPYVVAEADKTELTEATATSLAVTVENEKTAYPTAFLQSTSYDPSTVVIYENYPDKMADATIDVNSDVTFSLTNVSPLDDAIASKTVRRTILNGDKLYVLALDSDNEPYIYVADLTAGTVTELDKAAVALGANGRLKISDIALTADGVLVASGLSKTQFSADYVQEGETRGATNFYKWTVNETTGLPETCGLWFTLQTSASYYRALLGKTIAYSGTLEDGIMTITAPTASGTNMRYVQVAIYEGEYLSSSVCTTTLSASATTTMSSSDDYLMSVSPLNDNNQVFDGNLCAPFEWNTTPEVVGTVPTTDLDVKSNGISFFKMAGKSYMVAPTVNSNGLVAGVGVYDVTSGFGSATLVTSKTIETAAEYNYIAAHACVVPNADNTAAEVKLYLVAEKTVEVPKEGLEADLADKTIRRQLLTNDHLITLAVDANSKSYVYVSSINDSTYTTLGTTAATGDIYPISDIALTDDGYLVGINKATQAYYTGNGVTANVNIYKWNNDANGVPTGEVSVWWTSNRAGNYTSGITGESLIYDGTLIEGKLVYTATTASGSNTRLVIYDITGGTKESDNNSIYNIQDVTYLTTSYLGETYKMTLSPRADDQIIFNSATIQPFEIKLNATNKAAPTILASASSDVINAKAINESYMTVDGKHWMIAPSIDSDGNAAGVTVLDITDGLNAATATMSFALDAATGYTYASAFGELSDYTDYDMYLAIDGNVTKWGKDVYTSATLTKGSTAGTANPFAYALSSEVADDVLSVKFSLNTAATAVNIIVKDEKGEEVASATGATTAGEQTAQIDLSGLENGSYTWEVAVESEARTTVSQFAAWKFYHPCGLDVDNSNESASFGTLFVAEGYTNGKTTVYVSAQADGTDGGGLYMFTAAGEQIANTAKGGYRFYGNGLTFSHNITSGSTAGADFSKVAVADDGRIFVTRYNLEGDYILSAPSLEELVANGEFTTSLVAGMTMTNNIYNDASGNFLVGPVQSFDVKGSGENTKLIALTRADNTIEIEAVHNRIVEYSLGTADVLPTPSSVTAYDQRYTISYDRSANVAYDDRGGIWYCQYRGTPDNVNPALVYADENGELKYFEGVGGNARRRAGLAVSLDGTRLAASQASGVISVYDILRDDNGQVYLNEAFRITHNIGENLYALTWDAAGNLYAASASSEYVIGVSVPRAEEAYTTNAASKYAFEINRVPVSVDEIGAEDAPVEYYNLQGIKVENPSKGIYIKKQGKKTTKVVL